MPNRETQKSKARKPQRMKMPTPKQGDLRVWHIPQVPGDPFYVPVVSPHQAIYICDVLSQYDLFQFEQNVKLDFSNAQGLEVYVDTEWADWYNDDGEDFREWQERLEEEAEEKPDDGGLIHSYNNEWCDDCQGPCQYTGWVEKHEVTEDSEAA
jgi:hypothetical protein